MKWNTELYDNKHDFVSEYGIDLIQLLKPLANENILDIGCGTGDLAYEISKTKARVTGIDSSDDMIIKARQKYPHLSFSVNSASAFISDKKFDAVFSNATLHWVLEKEKAIQSIYNALKPNGRFVAEFGGNRNVEGILTALKNVLMRYGYIKLAHSKIWYFPSLPEYASLLENNGFTVTYAKYFKRETALKSTNGIRDWLKMFAQPYLNTLHENVSDKILEEVENELMPTHYKNCKWYADYVRLRVEAVREN